MIIDLFTAYFKRRYFILVLFQVVTLGVVSPAFAASVCTNKDALLAESEPAITSWEALYRSYQRFAQCDDGEISEGYTYAIGQLLTIQWRELEKLNVLVSKDSEFGNFVLKHINELLPNDELKTIQDNAQTKCPDTAKKLCAGITDAAKIK